MSEEYTPPTEEPVELGSWIVVHQNPSGHQFATRVEAESAEAAGETIAEVHEAQQYLHVYPDEGQEEVEYQGATIKVVDLSDEP